MGRITLGEAATSRGPADGDQDHSPPQNRRQEGDLPADKFSIGDAGEEVDSVAAGDSIHQFPTSPARSGSKSAATPPLAGAAAAQKGSAGGEAPRNFAPRGANRHRPQQLKKGAGNRDTVNAHTTDLKKVSKQHNR